MIYIRQHTEGFYSRVMGGGGVPRLLLGGQGQFPSAPHQAPRNCFPSKTMLSPAYEHVK